MPVKSSVIIPVLNKGPHVLRALRSVLAQTVNDFEVIVVDGGSSDGGPDLVARLSDPRIRLIRQGGKGPGNARNEGVFQATSGFIAFLDADDEWLPDHLEVLLDLERNFPAAGLYATVYVRVKDGKSTPPNLVGIPPAPWEGYIGNHFRSAVLGDSPLWTSAIGMRKEIFLGEGGFDESAMIGEDTDLWNRVAIASPVSFSWRGGASYHKDSVNRLSGRPVPERSKRWWGKGQEMLETEKVPKEFKNDFREFIAKSMLRTAQKNINLGYHRCALTILFRCTTKQFKSYKLKLIVFALMPHYLYRQITGFSSRR